MAEVRTVSSSGGEKGVKDEALHLIPRKGVEAIARVFGFGATKYADHNWRRGYEWSKSYAALQRHLLAFWDGETNDPESGLPHLAHAGFHIMALLTWLEEQGEGGEFDDRYVPTEPEVNTVNVEPKFGLLSGTLVGRPPAPDWAEVVKGVNERVAQAMENDAFRRAMSQTLWD